MKSFEAIRSLVKHKNTSNFSQLMQLRPLQLFILHCWQKASIAVGK